MTLRCLATHPHVWSILLDQGGLLVGNIFGERFDLTPGSVEGMLAFMRRFFLVVKVLRHSLIRGLHGWWTEVATKIEYYWVKRVRDVRREGRWLRSEK